jgi:hypothetical protein
VIESNLDVWKSRICPVVIYEPMETSEKVKARAKKAGKPVPAQVKDLTEFRTGTLDSQSDCSYYLGVDTQDLSDPSVWRWNGSGMLFALTSDWQMVRHDADYTWAITVFGPTTFTAAGFDIYYRQPVMPAETLAEVKAIIEADPYLKARAVGMFRTIQDPRGRDRQ